MEKQLVGVRFKNVGKVYYFSTIIDLNKLDKVVVETARGLEMGEVVTDLKALDEFNLTTELKEIIRKANDDDLFQYQQNLVKAKESLNLCKEIIENHKLDMRLVHCEYTLDATKVIFMYTSDERVDFRELLKELASAFKCRIELRQIGPRDKAKLIGGLGSCGMPLCCSTFLGEFNGVSINMAKNQMLAINIDKISGACGRLMCCLKYEDQLYLDIKKTLPRLGQKVTYNDKIFKVTGLNILSKTVKIENRENTLFLTVEELNGSKKEITNNETNKFKKISSKEVNLGSNGNKNHHHKQKNRKEIKNNEESRSSK
jgi:Uncharacterized homolog of PSP1